MDWRAPIGHRAAALVALGALIASSCGQIDEIRDVFDTTPEDGVEDGLAAGTTLPIVPLGSRFAMPPSRVLDEFVVYTLDPDLAPPIAQQPSVGRQPGVPGTAPIPTDPGTSAPARDVPPGPLTHVRVHMSLDANVREVEAARDALNSYVPLGAAVAEFGPQDVVSLLRALYDDDPLFVEALGSGDGGVILLLSHRWPETSGLRTEVVRSARRLDGVDDVESTALNRIHRASLTVDAPDQLVARFRIGPPGSNGFFVHEGQRVTFLDRAGVVRGVSIAAPGESLPEHLVLDPNDAATAASVIPGQPIRPLDEGCEVSDSRGLIEVRLCRYRSDAVGIELRTGGGSWNPLVGAPDVPRIWRDRPPFGASAAQAEWSVAFLSPDDARVLAQWNGSCLTDSAAVIDSVSASITWLEASTNRPWGPGSRALGWTTDGRAVVYLGHEECGEPAPIAGLFLLDAEGDLVEVLSNGTGDGIQVTAGTWAHIDP